MYRMRPPPLVEPRPPWAGERLSRAQAWRAEWAFRREALDDSLSPELRRAARVAVEQGFVITVAQARAAGVERAQVRRLVRLRDWSVQRRGTLAVVGVGTHRRSQAA